MMRSPSPNLLLFDSDSDSDNMDSEDHHPPTATHLETPPQTLSPTPSTPLPSTEPAQTSDGSGAANAEEAVSVAESPGSHSHPPHSNRQLTPEVEADGTHQKESNSAHLNLASSVTPANRSFSPDPPLADPPSPSVLMEDSSPEGSPSMVETANASEARADGEVLVEGNNVQDSSPAGLHDNTNTTAANGQQRAHPSLIHTPRASLHSTPCLGMHMPGESGEGDTRRHSDASTRTPESGRLRKGQSLPADKAHLARGSIGATPRLSTRHTGRGEVSGMPHRGRKRDTTTLVSSPSRAAVSGFIARPAPRRRDEGPPTLPTTEAAQEHPSRPPPEVIDLTELLEDSPSPRRPHPPVRARSSGEAAAAAAAPTPFGDLPRTARATVDQQPSHFRSKRGKGKARAAPPADDDANVSVTIVLSEDDEDEGESGSATGAAAAVARGRSRVSRSAATGDAATRSRRRGKRRKVESSNTRGNAASDTFGSIEADAAVALALSQDQGSDQDNDGDWTMGGQSTARHSAFSGGGSMPGMGNDPPGMLHRLLMSALGFQGSGFFGSANGQSFGGGAAAMAAAAAGAGGAGGGGGPADYEQMLALDSRIKPKGLTKASIAARTFEQVLTAADVEKLADKVRSHHLRICVSV